MYGMHVHEAVLASGEHESGITIQYINEHYDQGDIIFQAKCPVLSDDTVETLAQRVHALGIHILSTSDGTFAFIPVVNGIRYATVRMFPGVHARLHSPGADCTSVTGGRFRCCRKVHAVVREEQ